MDGTNDIILARNIGNTISVIINMFVFLVILIITGGMTDGTGGSFFLLVAAEVEPNARTVWEANHGRVPDVGDILLAPASEAKFAHVYTVSLPCQSSSQAGRQASRTQGSTRR